MVSSVFKNRLLSIALVAMLSVSLLVIIDDTEETHAATVTDHETYTGNIWIDDEGMVSYPSVGSNMGITYNSTTHTLTLDNARIIVGQNEYYENYAFVTTEDIDLTIKLVGETIINIPTTANNVYYSAFYNYDYNNEIKIIGNDKNTDKITFKSIGVTPTNYYEPSLIWSGDLTVSNCSLDLYFGTTFAQNSYYVYIYGLYVNGNFTIDNGKINVSIEDFTNTNSYNRGCGLYVSGEATFKNSDIKIDIGGSNGDVSIGLAYNSGCLSVNDTSFNISIKDSLPGVRGIAFCVYDGVVLGTEPTSTFSYAKSIRGATTYAGELSTIDGEITSEYCELIIERNDLTAKIFTASAVIVGVGSLLMLIGFRAF